MTIFNFKSFSKKRNWTIVKSCSYGEVNGYLITLMGSSNYKRFFIPLISIGEENKTSIKNYLAENKKKFKILKFNFFKDVLYLKFTEGYTGAKAEDIDNTLQSITDFLKSINFVNKNCCVFCGKEATTEKTYIDNICYHSHYKCSSEAKNEVDIAIREYNNKSKNYLLGSIGALLGGLLCNIPWILTVVFLNRIAAIMAVIIALGASKGYTLFKGRVGVMTRWIVAFATIIAVVAANVSTLFIQMMQNKIPVNATTIQLILNDEEVMRILKGDFITSLAMASLGLLAVIFTIKGSAKQLLPEIKSENFN